MADNTTNTSPSTEGMIRNINQTVQEREIIKTAPDIIIYLDGKTYLLNPYISNIEAGEPYTFVSFNDYVQNFSSTCDVDNLVPSGNFTLQVPNFSKHLFQTPGGNNLIESMMEVQVFAKGYYPSGNGNTVYHRIFKGLVSHVAHTDNGMVLEISVQCLGVMHLLEYMYVDLNPSLLSNSERAVTPMGSNQFNMNPYEQLADTFLRGITFEGFQLNAISQSNVHYDHWGAAVAAGFCNKWQPILVNIRKEVHITGYRPGSVLPQDIDGITTQVEDASDTNDPRLISARLAQKALLAQNVPNPNFYVDVVKGYLPDMTTGSIQLTNGRVTSRLERIRTIVQLIGYEGYQDLDGTIIFKPPLYNLDVTNIGSSVVPTTNTQSGPQATVDITDVTNPFVVYLSEIEAESESEDQQAIKATRVTIQPSWLPGLKTISDSATAIFRPAITHIDIPKLARFGLREEPAKTLGWIGIQDKVVCYTYAVSELNRANRGWRTYNLTIPLRPELKLGFPMYIPHKDMYGYIKSISVSYSYGGAATMSILLDTLRKRPMFPQVKTQVTGQQNTVYTDPPVIYTTQPNLVMQWTKGQAQPGSSNLPSNSPAATTTPSVSSLTDAIDTNALGAATGGNTVDWPVTMTKDGFPSARSTANLLYTPATQPQPLDKPVYAEDLEVVSARRTQYGTSWSTKADTRENNFVVQDDKATATDQQLYKNGNGQPIKAGDPFFSAANWYDKPQQGASTSTTTSPPTPPQNGGVNMSYMQKVLSSQPFTDEKGYEVVTPFPWGRWKTLKEAIYETHQGILVVNSTSDQAQLVQGTDVFLFAGVGSATAVTDPSSSLQSQLTTLSRVADLAASTTSFELVTPKPGDKQFNSLASQQPDSNITTTLNSDTQGKTTSTFISGTTPVQRGSAFGLAAQLKMTIQNNPNVVGATGTAVSTQNQNFISKLISSNTTTNF